MRQKGRERAAEADEVYQLVDRTEINLTGDVCHLQGLERRIVTLAEIPFEARCDLFGTEGEGCC